MSSEHVDVLIVGAGISGIGVACHLARDLPQLSYGMLERRRAIGGTWDLFRYPGVRSDSDMYTFGYSFRPWRETPCWPRARRSARYLNETADEYGCAITSSSGSG